MTACSLRSLVDEYFRAWNDHDFPALAQCLSAGFFYRDPLKPMGLDSVGLSEYLQQFWSAIRGSRIDTGATLVGDSGGAACEWVLDGHFQDVSGGRANTRRHIRLHGVHVFVVRDGAISLAKGYFDLDCLNEQIGRPRREPKLFTTEEVPLETS